MVLASPAVLHAEESHFTTLRITHASSYPTVIQTGDLFIVVFYEAIETLGAGETTNGPQSAFLKLDGGGTALNALRIHSIPTLGHGLAVAYLPPTAGGWTDALSVSLIVNPTQFHPVPDISESGQVSITACRTCDSLKATRDALRSTLITRLPLLGTASGQAATYFIDSTTNVLTTEGQTLLNNAYGGFNSIVPSLYDVQYEGAFDVSIPPTPGPREEAVREVAERSQFFGYIKQDAANLGIPMITMGAILMVFGFGVIIYLTNKFAGSAEPAFVWVTPCLLLGWLVGILPMEVVGGLLALMILVFMGLAVRKVMPT